jgi:hypothetical protein
MGRSGRQGLADDCSRPRRLKALAPLVLFALLLSGCGGGGEGSGGRGAAPLLYLTIVMHTEEDVHGGTEPKAQIPDYDGDEALFRHFAGAVTRFGQMAASHGARINFGSDWTFSAAVELYDPSFYPGLESMGHEVDAHAHESFVPYHEVRQWISRAGGSPTQVASGLSEAAAYGRMEYFDDWYPEFQILWGVSLPGHAAGECVAGWVWRPSRSSWTEHDPAGDYILIGHGQLVNSLEAIAAAIDQSSSDRINTYAVFVSPREFKAARGSQGIDPAWMADRDDPGYWENRLVWWDDFLTGIDDYVAQGEVEYATLTEIADLFVSQEGRLSFPDGDCPRSDAPLVQRNREAGYRP